MFKKNPVIRSITFLAIIAALYFHHAEFIKQFQCYLTGQANVIQAQWHITVLNIVLFLLFLIPLGFRRRARWGEYGLVTAFFVSLFIEMYGFPLTIYFASRYFAEPVQCAENVFTFGFWGVRFGMETAMVYATAFMTIGTLLIIIGWVTLYRHRNEGPFVTTGIYQFSRHPQYLGFILVIFGWFIDWPTLITVIFAPLLIFQYIRVCRKEEREILKEHPEYQDYMDKVPFLM